MSSGVITFSPVLLTAALRKKTPREIEVAKSFSPLDIRADRTFPKFILSAQPEVHLINEQSENDGSL